MGRFDMLVHSCAGYNVRLTVNVVCISDEVSIKDKTKFNQFIVCVYDIHGIVSVCALDAIGPMVKHQFVVVNIKTLSVRIDHI
jgi:hypothetical protein